jgi:hypothetical protein
VVRRRRRGNGDAVGAVMVNDNHLGDRRAGVRRN